MGICSAEFLQITEKRTPHTVQRPFLYPSNALLSRAAARQVSSAPQSLTTVFGMGTGVSSASLSLSYQIRLFSPNTFSNRFLRADLTSSVLPALYPVCLRILSRYSFQFFPWSSPRPISITQLNTLLHLHLQPINQLVFLVSYQLNVVGYLILGWASHLDAFSVYPFHT